METRPAKPERSGTKDDLVVETLAKSQVCRKYQRDFTQATGLPLRFCPTEAREISFREQKNENGFCASIAQRNAGCRACLQLQEKLLKRATHRACTLVCPFGMMESAIPVRSGAKLLGFLRTGQVFCERPSFSQFPGVVEKLRANGVLETGTIKQLYFATPVIRVRQYKAMIGLLSTFADQLAESSNQIVLQQINQEPVTVSRAKEYIREHYTEELSLARVAQVVNTSPSYLCRLFRRTTGVNFNQYRTRVRLEAARQRLLNPNLHVGEVAYAVGFQSLTHFNRVFKKFIGLSPTAYRAERLER